MSGSSVAIILLLIAVFAAGFAFVLFAGRRKFGIRTLLLDADGTLLDFDRAERLALTEALGEFGVSVDDELYGRYHRNNDDCWKALEKGEMTRAELKVVRFARTFAESGVTTVDPADAAAVYEKKLGTYAFPFPEAEDTVAALSRRYDVYIVTNGLKSVQDAKMKLTRFPEYWTGIYISEAVGYAKPAKEFFDVIFRDHPKLRPETTLIVGDSLTGDIQGGMNAGLRTCWVNREGLDLPEEYRVDLQIKAVSELKELL